MSGPFVGCSDSAKHDISRFLPVSGFQSVIATVIGSISSSDHLVIVERLEGNELSIISNLQHTYKSLYPYLLRSDVGEIEYVK